jgi:putative membrane protein
VLGISAGFLLVVGLLRVFFFEKGAAYYFHSHAFMTKFSVFIAVGLLSIIPTLEFLSWRKPVKAGEIPAVSARNCGSFAASSTANWPRLSSFCFAPR